MPRKFLHTFADLIDALSIDQIKMIKMRRYKDSYSREIEKICHDIDLIIRSRKKVILNARILRIITTIALVNLFIWNLKDQMQEDSKKYDSSLKLAHQLNGIRNRMKNLLLEAFDDTEPSLKRTNTELDDLNEWDISI